MHPGVPGILNVSFDGVEGESLFGALPGWRSPPARPAIRPAREPSYVLRALGRDARARQSSLRFSLGRFTTAADVDRAVSAVRARGRAAAGPLAGGGACGRAGGLRPPARVTGEAGSPG